MKKSGKLRLTAQRAAILDIIQEHNSHLTADQVYEYVRLRIPHISLGTIYRNLAILSQYGLIRQIDVPNGPMRFDGKTDCHYHVRCTACGCLNDVYIEPLPELEMKAQLLTKYIITGHRLEFVGLCPACQAKGPANEEVASVEDTI
ncbi:MAG: Fur family transcriptional regulator [Candidatus Zipacnadales bacterium]